MFHILLVIEHSLPYWEVRLLSPFLLAHRSRVVDIWVLESLSEESYLLSSHQLWASEAELHAAAHKEIPCKHIY